MILVRIDHPCLRLGHHRKCQLLATLCVALSLAFIALGGVDPISKFCLRTLSFAGPSLITEPICDTVALSHAIIAGTMYEGWGGV
jgi:hypothetical protein